jgi:hypothetical protein
MMTLAQRLHPHPQVVDTELEGEETVLPSISRVKPTIA